MQLGDLVQVLPAKVGYYVVVGPGLHEDGTPLNGPLRYWQLQPLPSANFCYGGPMEESYIEVVSEAS